MTCSCVITFIFHCSVRIPISIYAALWIIYLNLPNTGQHNLKKMAASSAFELFIFN